MKRQIGAAFAALIAGSTLAFDVAAAMPAQALSGPKLAGVTSGVQSEQVVYRRRVAAPRHRVYGRRVYARRGYYYNPAPAAILGAMTGIVGAGIAASQADNYYYPRAYGYPVYPAYPVYPGYGYGYGGW